MIENHICSFELAKKIKEAGRGQESLFYYVKVKDIGDHILENEVTMIAHISQFSGIGESFIAAFTASELLDVLPNIVTTKENEPFNNFRIKIFKSIVVQNGEALNVYHINYYCDTTETEGENAWIERKLISPNIYDTNLANAAAKMLINLIENKFYGPK